MKIGKGTIILVALVLYFGVMAVINVNKDKDINKEILKEVIIVKDGKVYKKNDSKLVLVTGKISYDGTVRFSELNSEIDSFKVTRKVEDYISYKTPGGTKSHKWVNREKVKDAESDNILDTLNTVTIKKDTKIGQFELDRIGMDKIKNSKIFKDDSKIGNLEMTGLYYSDPAHEEDGEEVGDVKVTYTYFDTEKTPYLTVLAEQNGNTFIPYRMKGQEVYKVMEGIINTNKLLKAELKKEVKTTSKGKILFIAMILALGIFFILDNKKEKK